MKAVKSEVFLLMHVGESCFVSTAEGGGFSAVVAPVDLLLSFLFLAGHNPGVQPGCEQC